MTQKFKKNNYHDDSGKTMVLSILKIALIIAGVLPTTGSLYHYAASKYENYCYAPLGKMVDIGGYKLPY